MDLFASEYLGKSNIPTFPELKNSAFIRELHVYGDLSGVGQSKGSNTKDLLLNY